MSRSISSPIHSALVAYLIDERKKAGLTQTEVARRLGRHQSFVATIESGQRRIDLVDLFGFAEAVGFSPLEAVRQLLDSEL